MTTHKIEMGEGARGEQTRIKKRRKGASWRTVHWQAPNILYMNNQSIVKKVDELGN